jgi:Mg2+ and Co2+ transporter CorA
MISTVRSLKEYYRAIQEDRMNKTLYVLTLVTSVFVPAQFLTGLYGMNFKVMPELNWAYGYYVFWVVVVASTAAVLLWLKSMKGSLLRGHMGLKDDVWDRSR